MAVTRVNEFHAAEGKAAELRAFLLGVIGQIEGAPGCLSVRAYVDPNDPARIAIIEEWSDVASHQAAAGRIPPEQMASFMPLVAEAPRGRYYEAI